MAEEKELASISIPAISSGIFGFPLEKCADICIQTVARYVSEKRPSSLSTIRYVIIDHGTMAPFRDALRRLQPQQ